MISGILMNEKPVSKDEIFKELDEYQAMDCCYSDGRILGSMCTEAHPIAKEAFYKFDKKINGFANSGALLTFPETRSSSPVRILRNDFVSPFAPWLYPAGEGAGYAGGIMSAAVDGIRVSESIIDKLNA